MSTASSDALSRQHILVTGGTGYIGSHTVVELIHAGHQVIMLDNLSNSSVEVLDRIAKITGVRPDFIQADVTDRAALDALFARRKIDAVLHFAGLKAVGESVADPLRYYHNNVFGSLCLLQAMQQAGVRTLVFSSSATVYGDPDAVPVKENAPLRPANPYGRSKLMIERMLSDLSVSDAGWRIAVLRYFNPVGAHASGLIGEAPQGIPNNLMPFLCQVAAGQREYLSVFGNDYPTPDGTCIRDYIHVVDLALGHLKALDKLAGQPGLLQYNLGTGRGHSVLEVINAFRTGAGVDVPYRFAERRAGDVPCYYADPAHAELELGWKAGRDLETMCRDAWRWQTDNH
ncbi:MAG: UDP-glucose 4-epimerase GalE [Methylobacterium sp.]|nr:UDP-glucose 4-epimerase GalE [Methylobacterium sp.]